MGATPAREHEHRYGLKPKKWATNVAVQSLFSSHATSWKHFSAWDSNTDYLNDSNGNLKRYLATELFSAGSFPSDKPSWAVSWELYNGQLARRIHADAFLTASSLCHCWWSVFSESPTIEDFGAALHLMRSDLEHLRSVFMAVENGDLGMLKSLGIKDSELGDVKFFLEKLVNTGFLD